MAANVTDKITDTRNAARPNSARATGTRASGGASLACDNLAGWPTASKVHFVTYQVDSSSAVVAGTQLDCTGIVTGNTIGSFTVVDGTDTGNSVGDYVEMLPTAKWGQDLADALTNQHSRTGAHVGINNTGGMTTDTLVVTSGTTLPAGDIGTADIANTTVTADKLSTGASTALVATGETTLNTTYVALATPGPAVTVTIGANGLALVTLFSKFGQDTQGKRAFMGFDISGATTLAAADNYAVEFQAWLANTDAAYGATFLVTGLAAGSTTFTAKYRVDANTGTFTNRRIGVVPL